MQLFYSPLLNHESKEYTLSRDESKHIVKVLRKVEGDTVFLTNGKGYQFQTTIASANSNKCTLIINSYTYQEPPTPKLHLAVAPTKLNDRYEWFIEKATEIGITEITPILCQNSERKVIKEERFTRILTSAMKQSLNLHLPILNSLTTLDQFLEGNQGDRQLFIAHCEEHEKTALKNILIPNIDCTILIGPEGDFSLDEIKNTLKTGYKPVTLGNNRLRTETAAIVACHTFNIVNE